jgi:hypothetical protein
MIRIYSAIRLSGSIQDAIACALLWWRLADGDLWFESSTTECVRARNRPTYGDLAVTGDEDNEIPISIGPGAIVLAAARLRKCLRHVFIFGFDGSGRFPN